MDFLDPMINGFGVVLQPVNLLYCFIGVAIGMLIGVLPGLGPTATIAILLPLSYGMEPVTAIIMLAGIYYGAQYGGTITSVLLRLPGEASSVVTVFDGYALAKQGRAGTALGIAAIGSFIGGTLAIFGLALFAPIVARYALDFGPPEYAAMTVLGVLLVATVGNGHKLKSVIAATVGLLLATVGRDIFTGAPRFTFGNLALMEGIGFIAIAMGVFGLGEIIYNIEQRHQRVSVPAKVANVWPSGKDLKQASGAMGRGSVLGFALGVLPGGGATLSSMVSYSIEKRRAKNPERFGRGAIEGVAGPETANNAAATSSFIPLLTLGIPANATMAIMLGALLIQGITPGPQLVSEHPDLFWGVINSMFIGNILLLIMSIPLVGIFVKILRVREGILAPITALITLLGVYTISNSIFDMVLVIVFGVLGYLMKKFGFDAGPLVLAFVLGGLLESSVRQSMRIFDGDATGFLTRPISATLIVMFFIVALLPAIQKLWKRRRLQLSKKTEPATDEKTKVESTKID
ncbi:tripartite tricarboxylate transporter permease [Pseudarthrobacter raffinosi]|uniref:tripartite tricarboxylate transporter permease n=1 Tax=Pseudarthrobacter raffinosi TaxID=2953651 RepID=UPI00208F5270|nr:MULTISPECIES: tripartite tricarboxylate transporter permease [unclassified Pseudarthrobacter]MCO4251198.1 tripartite tricarboxylate transporter permease [Pseudarthrobacter sp. MDT3-9]MCO4265086.1 tripartite tricarboxylate transporter permease [Pseudarthrobacter sp. MDT3-26]